MRPLCRGFLSNSSHFFSALKLPPPLATTTTGVRTRSFGIRGTKPKMGNNKEDKKNNIQTNPGVNKIQQLIHHHSSSDTSTTHFHSHLQFFSFIFFFDVMILMGTHFNFLIKFHNLEFASACSSFPFNVQQF